jgi:hypothetical protein
MARPFQDHPSKLEETEKNVETMVDSQSFAEFVAALEGTRPDVNALNIHPLMAFCSGLGVEEPLTALQAFDAFPPHSAVSLIREKSRRCILVVDDTNV